MDNVIYLNDDDAILFNQLISEGLTEKQAVEQMKLMGIANPIVLNNVFGYAPIKPDMVIYDELKEEPKPKKKLPWYYGKRRY